MLTTREKKKRNTGIIPLNGHEQVGSSKRAEGIAFVRCTERSPIVIVSRCNCKRVGKSGGSWSILSSVCCYCCFLLLS